MASSRVHSKSKDIVYPESDGKPLGETGWHIDAIFEFYFDLRALHGARKDVYIASNMFLYYEEGDPSKVVCPDCMVIFGVEGNHKRATFKTWVEHVVPTFILEVSSSETIHEDLGEKKAIYAELGIAEYFLFDSMGECLDPSLLGFRLDADGIYQPISLSADSGLPSETLKHDVIPENNMLRLVNRRTGVAGHLPTNTPT